MNQLEPPDVIGELMRAVRGRLELHANFQAGDWLIEHGYATRFGYRDIIPTDKGRALAEKIIHASGLRVIMGDL
jgi:hypothetical protein